MNYTVVVIHITFKIVEEGGVEVLSVQLYTVRKQLAANSSETLEHLSRIGFTRIEPFAFVEQADALAPHCERLGLAAPTAHQGLLGADLAGVFTAAKKLGITTVIDPMIDPERWTTRERVEGVAQDLKQIAEQARDQGLRIGYHNHAFELENRIGGVPALEVFADSVGDAVVLEVDTYWAEVGGVSSIELVRSLSEQIAAIHIKDGPKTKENKDQVAVGDGSMPVRELLAAAPDALPVVELDDHSGEIFNALRRSYQFLTSGESA